MHECGEQISEQVKSIPEKISVIKHRQTKYACRECEATSISSSVVTAPKPAQPIPGSIASPEALAAVVVAKYCDALPLYRLTDILARDGLEITRGTLANWCIKSAALLSPLIAAIKIHYSPNQHSAQTKQPSKNLVKRQDGTAKIIYVGLS